MEEMMEVQGHIPVQYLFVMMLETAPTVLPKYFDADFTSCTV